MALDKNNTDRSYLYGRLLAVFEHVERSTYPRWEGREPNAMRLQSTFCRRPLYARSVLEERLQPYFRHLSPGLRAYFRNIIGEITEKLSQYDDTQLAAPLSEIYLMGYYLQRSELLHSKNNDNKEESEV